MIQATPQPVNPDRDDERYLLRRHYLAAQEHPECTLGYLDFLSRLYWKITFDEGPRR